MSVYSATTSSNKYITLELETRVDSQSVANNTTTISWWLRVRKSGSSTSATWGQCSYSANINGSQYSGSSSVSVSPGGATALLSGTVTVPHNADGTKSISVSGSISGKIVGSVSGSQTLSTIPRASSITAPTFTLGSAGTITINRASSGFTHTLEYWYGSAKGTIVTKTSSTSVSWTPPLDLASQTPSATQGTGTLICTTYSGNTQIGQSSIAIKIQVPSSVVPSISSVAISEAVSGLASKFGAYVQGKSKLRIQTYASGAYGSTISNCMVNVADVTYSGLDVTSNIISKSGVVSVVATVTDSRGRSASKTVSVDFVAYSQPAIYSFSVHRCNADWTDNANGDYAYISYNFAVASVGDKNSKSAIIQYKRATSSDWSTLVDLSSGAYAQSSAVVPSTVMSSDYQYDIRLTVADYFSASVMTAQLRSSEVIIDFLSSGNGAAFGKTAETKGALDVGWKLVANKGIIMASGKSVIDEAVDAVEVGGTNLLEGSRTLQSFSVTGDLVNNAYHDLTAVETSAAWKGIYVDLPSVVSKWGLQAGDIVTHSVMVMTDFDADTVCSFSFYRAPEKNDFIRLGDYTLRPGKWQKISVTFAIPAGEMSTIARIETDYYTENTGYSFGGKHMYFAAPKLERGNKATDWTPCPTETADYVVASGTSGIWTYIKYSSGLCECFGMCPVNYANGYVLDSWANLPFTFAQNICVEATLMYIKNASTWLAENVKAAFDGSDKIRVSVNMPGGGYTSDFKESVSVHVVGRWK